MEEIAFSSFKSRDLGVVCLSAWHKMAKGRLTASFGPMLWGLSGLGASAWACRSVPGKHLAADKARGPQLGRVLFLASASSGLRALRACRPEIPPEGWPQRVLAVAPQVAAQATGKRIYCIAPTREQ